jgi:hypothetical protein
MVIASLETVPGDVAVLAREPFRAGDRLAHRCTGRATFPEPDSGTIQLLASNLRVAPDPSRIGGPKHSELLDESYLP